MSEIDERDRQRQEDLERIRNFRLMDDDFLTKCFENNVDATKLMLDIILPVKLTVRRVTTQATIKSLQGRSIRLDILAEDEAGGKANVEIQRDSRGAGAKRARYNGSILDANSILSGEDCEDLPENFVVFITEKDVFHKGLPIYIFERYCITPDGPMAFDDKLHIIYVNGQIQDETPLGLWMHDFFCTNPDDMHYKVLADRVRYFKQTEEGVSIMCKAMEDMRNEAVLKHAKETVLRMLANGKLTHEEIAECVGLTLAQVKELAQEKSA